MSLPPSQTKPAAQHPRHRAFTLVEILAVVAILGLLMGLILSIGPAAVRAYKEAVAKGHMAELQTAIESFKNTYGYYPPSDIDEEDGWRRNLHALLLGYKVPKMRDNKLTLVEYTEAAENGQATPTRRPFLKSQNSIPTNKDSEGKEIPEERWTERYFIDPWDNAYAYRYKLIRDGVLDGINGAIWRNPAYLLISAGARYNDTGDPNGLLPDDYFIGDMQNTGLIPADENTYFRDNRIDNLTSWKDK
jgi:prepilin-type N-terminal cleavage/methylation domain-containing protein